MKRFSIRFLLLLITIAAILIWWFDSGYREIYRKKLVTHGEVVVYGKKRQESGDIILKVRFTPTGTKPERLDAIQPFCIHDTSDFPELKSITDKTSGLWCIFDGGKSDFVFLAYPPGKGKGNAFWHPGVHLGWGRGFWADRYKTLRSLNPKLPYDSLPHEQLWVVD